MYSAEPVVINYFCASRKPSCSPVPFVEPLLTVSRQRTLETTATSWPTLLLHESNLYFSFIVSVSRVEGRRKKSDLLSHTHIHSTLKSRNISPQGTNHTFSDAYAKSLPSESELSSSYRRLLPLGARHQHRQLWKMAYGLLPAHQSVAATRQLTFVGAAGPPFVGVPDGTCLVPDSPFLTSEWTTSKPVTER